MAHNLSLGEYVVAGGIAGTTEVLALYPLDVVKTRFQLQTGANMSVAATFRAVIKEEGVVNLYRGIISPIMAEAPKRATKFGVNEMLKKALSDDQGNISTRGAIAAGAGAGVTESFGNCPFEVVKVRMQAKQNLGLYKNTFDALRQLIQTEGVTALYKGLEAQAWRNGVWNGAYFGIINRLKEAIPINAESPNKVLLRNFFAGFIGGTIATSCNTPFDVAKSRIQNVNLDPKAPRFNFAFPAMAHIVQTEGVKALYKGFVPKVLRLGPGGGIMIVVFDKVVKYMHENKGD